MIENRRKYESQLKYKKEMERLLGKDLNAVVPPRKRGRPVRPESQRTSLKELRESFDKDVENQESDKEIEELDEFQESDEENTFS